MAAEPARESPWKRRLIIGAVVIVVGFGCFLLTITVGHVEGVEFAPTHFQTRKFEFYQIPVLGIQVSPIYRTAIADPTTAHLVTNKYITVPTGPPAQWDLVRFVRGGTKQYAADPALLTELLNADNPLLGSAGSKFEDWSTNHPQAAAELWPRVQQLAERDLYILIPRLVQTALNNDSDATKLKALLEKQIEEEQISLAKDLVSAKATDQAIELLKEALLVDPTNAALRKALAEVSAASASPASQASP